FRSSLLIELVNVLIEEGVFPPDTKKIFSKEYRLWVDRESGYEKYIGAVINAFDKKIKKVGEKNLRIAVDKVIALHRNRLYTYTRDLIKELKRKNYFLLAISHSPKYVVGKFAKKIGFNKVYGLLLELDEEMRLTGNKLHADLIFDKSKILKRAIEKESLTLKDSVGVGDTDSDIPFLKMVDKPICFNPNGRLYKAAKKNKWRVVVERKDVIYEI
ncbi:MAG: HAD-IB family phosphatase, partial [Candidatus Liptonbacteria bacterium]|nr:HAD-IB family phosphatase [Candidatus Liptonbacteria bacterium]